MINKYSGITIIVLALFSLIGSWMIYQKYSKDFYPRSSGYIDTQQLIRDINIKKEAFDALNTMEEIVSNLSQPPNSLDENFTIALSPKIDKEKRDVINIPTDKELQKRMAANICLQARKMNVSMSFVSDDDKYAVIANKFVRVGEWVGKKYKVTRIAADKVQLKKNGVSCTVKVSGVV